MSKITPSSADYQTFLTLFELEPVAGKKVTVNFTSPELSSLGGLTLVREYERSSSRIIERIVSCIKDPRRELTLFNAYYGKYCYMPLLLFEGRSGKLILPILRPGRGNKAINIAIFSND